MPQEKTGVDPADVNGIPLRPEEYDQSVETQGTATVARALGLKDEDTDDDDDLDDANLEDDDTDENDEEDDDTPPQRKDKATDRKSKGKSDKAQKGKVPENDDPVKIGEKYSDFVRRNAEEAYATALHRAKSEEGYLDKLVQSKDPMEQRIAKKLVERNSDLAGGAKTVEDYRKNLRKKEIGDDPVLQRLADIEERQERLDKGSASREWKQWKKENAVKGKAEELADDIHTRYPDMPEGEIMEMVKGKMGGEYRAPQKQNSSVLYGGDSSPQGDGELGLGSVNPRLASVLLPNMKKTKKFAKKYLAEMRK